MARRSASRTVASAGAAAPAPVQARRGKPRSKQEAAERLVVAAAELARQLPANELTELAVQTELAATDPARESAGVSALTGRPLPSVADVTAAQVRNLHRAFAERHELLADAINVGEVARLLRVGRQTPHDRLRSGTLVAAKDRGQWRFPVWQFDANGPDGVLHGLPETLRALRGPISDVGKVRWFLTSKDALDGRTPVEALHGGDVDDVVAAAEALGAS